MWCYIGVQYRHSINEPCYFSWVEKINLIKTSKLIKSFCLVKNLMFSLGFWRLVLRIWRLPRFIALTLWPFFLCRWSHSPLFARAAFVVSVMIVFTRIRSEIFLWRHNSSTQKEAAKQLGNKRKAATTSDLPGGDDPIDSQRRADFFSATNRSLAETIFTLSGFTTKIK